MRNDGIPHSALRIDMRQLLPRPIFHADVADDRHRPAGRCSLAADRRQRVEDLTEQADLSHTGGNRDRHCFVSDGRHCLDAAGAGASADPFEQVRGLPELARHCSTAEELPLHRQYAHDRGVACESAAGFDVLL
jgi:hypothetical protein